MTDKSTISSVPELIEAFGGGTKLARELGVKPNAVFNWRRRGAVPGALQLPLFMLAQERGLSLGGELLTTSRRPVE